MTSSTGSSRFDWNRKLGKMAKKLNKMADFTSGDEGSVQDGEDSINVILLCFDLSFSKSEVRYF